MIVLLRLGRSVLLVVGLIIGNDFGCVAVREEFVIDEEGAGIGGGFEKPSYLVVIGIMVSIRIRIPVMAKIGQGLDVWSFRVRVWVHVRVQA